jgi:hypothetical protein
MEMKSINMHFSLKKVILLSVLLNCVVISLSSAPIIILSCLFNFNISGFMGFFDLSIFVLLPIGGIIAGFKIGDLYILIYNTFAGLLNIQKIELNNQL